MELLESDQNWDQWCWSWDEERCCWRFGPCNHRRHDDCRRPRFRQHVHEFLGSTRLAENPHNHRFAGVSGPAIPRGRSHVHRIETLTDSTDHVHRIEDFTGEAIEVGDGRHVHFVRGRTSFDDGHEHSYIFATLIENPIERRD
jgi:hypothetical protein